MSGTNPIYIGHWVSGEIDPNATYRVRAICPRCRRTSCTSGEPGTRLRLLALRRGCCHCGYAWVELLAYREKKEEQQ